MKAALVWEGDRFRLEVRELQEGEPVPNGVAALVGIYVRLNHDLRFIVDAVSDGEAVAQVFEKAA